MTAAASRVPGSGTGRITVVGVHGGYVYGPGAIEAVARADVVVGSRRQLASTASRRAPWSVTVLLAGPLEPVLERIAADVRAGRRVCVLASGDPGFFGIVRMLSARFGGPGLAVHPAPSSVSLAFARLGLSWDDAAVVSAHGRPLADAVAAVRAAPSSSVAILTSPDNPPQAVAAGLLAAGEPTGTEGSAVVACRLGEDCEAVTVADLAAVARGTFDPMAVLCLTGRATRSPVPSLAWGLPGPAVFEADGTLTEAAAHAVVLRTLDLPPRGVLWGVGAGNGAVGIACARHRPGLGVFAVERDPERAQRIRSTALRERAAVTVVEGTAPDALHGLPDPDRIFVGGCAVGVLRAALERLRPAGLVVAAYVNVDRAVAAASVLGNVVELSVSRGVATGGVGVRQHADQPVFVCWGPDAG